jgi:hypothetical protein
LIYSGSYGQFAHFNAGIQIMHEYIQKLRRMQKYKNETWNTDVGQLYLEFQHVVDVGVDRGGVGAHFSKEVFEEFDVDQQQAVVATLQVVITMRHRKLALLIDLRSVETFVHRFRTCIVYARPPMSKS